MTKYMIGFGIAAALTTWASPDWGTTAAACIFAWLSGCAYATRHYTERSS